MNGDVLRSLLDVKTAMLDKQSQAVAAIRHEVEQLEKTKAEIEAALGALPDGMESGASLQAWTKWRLAEGQRLERLRQIMAETHTRLGDAEEGLKLALGEKRAIERLEAEARVG